jgi:glycine cleavage system H protein
MNPPEDCFLMDPTTLRFSPTHEWVHLEGDIATIGISKFAVDQLTDLIMIDLPAVGARLSAGKSFGEIESVKAVSDLYAPLSGEVVEVNSTVTQDVQVLAQEPFGQGWLIKMRVDHPSQVSSLLDHAAYERKVADEEH